MGALFGFVIGYLIGTKSGNKGLDEIKDAWKMISASDEFKGLTQTGMSIAGEVLKNGIKLRS